MRDLSPKATNKLTIRDTISGSDIVLFYKSPTPEEYVSYRSGLYRSDGEKIETNEDHRIRAALKILTGIGEDSFGYEEKPISSDPQSPNYREDWKELLYQTAPDILAMLSYIAYEGLTAIPKEPQETERAPFPKS